VVDARDLVWCGAVLGLADAAGLRAGCVAPAVATLAVREYSFGRKIAGMWQLWMLRAARGWFASSSNCCFRLLGDAASCCRALGDIWPGTWWR